MFLRVILSVSCCWFSLPIWVSVPLMFWASCVWCPLQTPAAKLKPFSQNSSAVLLMVELLKLPKYYGTVNCFPYKREEELCTEGMDGFLCNTVTRNAFLFCVCSCVWASNSLLFFFNISLAIFCG